MLPLLTLPDPIPVVQYTPYRQLHPEWAVRTFQGWLAAASQHTATSKQKAKQTAVDAVINVSSLHLAAPIAAAQQPHQQTTVTPSTCHESTLCHTLLGAVGLSPGLATGLACGSLPLLGHQVYATDLGVWQQQGAPLNLHVVSCLNLHPEGRLGHSQLLHQEVVAGLQSLGLIGLRTTTTAAGVAAAALVSVKNIAQRQACGSHKFD